MIEKFYFFLKKKSFLLNYILLINLDNLFRNFFNKNNSKKKNKNIINYEKEKKKNF
jgi:hypothetical protein